MSFTFQINPDRSFTHIIAGKVQSGKTGEIIRVCDELINAGITPVVIVRNRRCDMQQFSKRCARRAGIQTSETPQLEKNKVCVVLGNASQIKKIHSKLIEAEIEYSVVSDEGDIHFQTKKRNKKPTEIAFELLREGSNNVFCFTATVASLVKNENNPHKIYELSAPSGESKRSYFGVQNFTHVSTFAKATYVKPSNDDDDSSFGSDSAAAASDVSEVGLLDTEDMHTVYTAGVQREKTWIIHNTDRRRFVQHMIADWVQEKYPMYVTIVYNGDGIHMHIPIQGADTPKHKYLCYDQEGGEIPTIGQILTICKNYPYVTIICGELASRGISFVSDDYSTHCDFQYFRCGSNPHGEQLLQACRLSGVYDSTEQKQLTFFCNDKTWELITQHYKMCDQPPDGLIECFSTCGDGASQLQGHMKHVCRPQLR